MFMVIMIHCHQDFATNMGPLTVTLAQPMLSYNEYVFLLFHWTSNAGPSVTVGVSLYVLSISRLSEVDMVMMITCNVLPSHDRWQSPERCYYVSSVFS